MNQPVEKRLKPSWMAQVEAPQEYVIEFLNREGIGHKIATMDPKMCKATQQDVDPAKAKGIQEAMDQDKPLGPIYLSADDEILDGHHRAFAAIRHPDVEAISCIKLYQGLQDAMRTLNKIQDIFTFEKENNMPGFAEKYGNLAPGQAQPMGEADKDPATPEADNKPDPTVSATDTNGADGATQETDVQIPTDAVPQSAPQDNKLVPFESAIQNPKEMTLYIAKPLNTQARTGDFLLTEKKPAMKLEVKIAFDNLLEVKPEAMEGITFPTEAVLQEWLPGQDYAAEAKTQGLSQEVYMSREVNRLALQKGFDGINYADKLVQVINKIV